MTLYRPHRGSLGDAMAEAVEVADFAGLVEHLRSSAPGWWPEGDLPTAESVMVEPYGYDARIGWDTHIVMSGGSVWGFTSGPVEKA